jgi:hypothetical protein
MGIVYHRDRRVSMERVLSVCKRLFVRNSEDGILAGLAHSRDGVLLLGESITEGGSVTATGNTRSLRHSTDTGNTRKFGEHSLHIGVLEGSGKAVGGGVLIVFHVLQYIILSAGYQPQERGI